MKKLYTVAFDAVDRLIRLGRGSGLGSSMISQRAAKVNKDVLTQIDTMICFRSIGPHDRKALASWVEQKADVELMEEFLKSIVDLPTGTGWLWSPEWLKHFGTIQFRKKTTYVSSKTPEFGEVRKRVVQSNVEQFVGRFKKALDKAREENIEDTIKKSIVKGEKWHVPKEAARKISDLEKQVEQLQGVAAQTNSVKTELENEKLKNRKLTQIVQDIRNELKPYYRMLSSLFDHVDKVVDIPVSGVDKSKYQMWLNKLGAEKKMLEFLLEHQQQATKSQLQVALGLSRESIRIYSNTLQRAGLIRKDGDEIILKEV